MPPDTVEFVSASRHVEFECLQTRGVGKCLQTRWSLSASRHRMLYAASRRPSVLGGQATRKVIVCPRRCLSASVAFGAGASERPQVPRASWPVPRASQSGTLQARLLGATALGFRRHSLTAQASEQTGLDALRRIPGDPPRASRETAGGWLSRLGF